jgi:hypothetical protein
MARCATPDVGHPIHCLECSTGDFHLLPSKDRWHFESEDTKRYSGRKPMNVSWEPAPCDEIVSEQTIFRQIPFL